MREYNSDGVMTYMTRPRRASAKSMIPITEMILRFEKRLMRIAAIPDNKNTITATPRKVLLLLQRSFRAYDG